MTPPCRAWRPILAALAIAAGALAARAQDAAPDPAPAPLGLRGVDALPPPLADATPDEPPPDNQAAPPQPPGKPNKPDKTRKIRIGPQRRLLGLQPYRNAWRIGLRGGSPPLGPAVTPPPAIAALPLPPPRRRPPPDDKPFAPVGVWLGDVRLLPSIEEDGGYATNPLLTPTPAKGSAFETTQGTLAIESDWARNALRGSLTGGYTDYFNAPEADNPNGAGTLDGRLDVTRDLSLDADGRFAVTTQTPGSVSLPAGVTLSSNRQLPLVETFGTSVGGVQNFGDLALSLHGTLDRISYQNATLSDGSTLDLASDDFNDWGLKARVAYRISPVISPFVETIIDTRRYDDPVDFEGYARSSTGALGRAGVTLALTGQLSGDASIGYGERQYEDPRLPDLHAPLIDGSLIWSATPLTTVTLRTSTALNDTTNIGDSGAVTRSYTIDVSHALLRNLTLGANAGYVTDVYAGAPLHDSTTSFGFHADYDLSRDLVLRASASRAQYVSSLPGSTYINDIFMLGLRLQR